MLWLLPLSIFSLFALFSIMRGIRHANRRADPARHLGTTHLRTPADDFHDATWLPLCTLAAAETQRLLARPLSHDERQRLWKARSPLVLEIFLKELAANPPPGAALSLLLTLPSGLSRPDPTDWVHATRRGHKINLPTPPSPTPYQQIHIYVCAQSGRNIPMQEERAPCPTAFVQIRVHL